jgi:formate dehydrogenase subunit delta
MSSTIETLRRMADDIARNFEAMGHANSALATADHIKAFWDPRMRELIFADDHSRLSPTARQAIEHLQAGGQPGPQTRATRFNKVDEGGRSDAG